MFELIGVSFVVIEDDVFIGVGCVIVEGVVVKKGVVFVLGVCLFVIIFVYDCVNEC